MKRLEMILVVSVLVGTLFAGVWFMSQIPSQNEIKGFIGIGFAVNKVKASQVETSFKSHLEK